MLHKGVPLNTVSKRKKRFLGQINLRNTGVLNVVFTAGLGASNTNMKAIVNLQERHTPLHFPDLPDHEILLSDNLQN